MLSLIDLLFPKFCVGCGQIGSYICKRCTRSVQPILQNEAICPMCDASGFDGFTHPKCATKNALMGLACLYHYTGAIKQIVKHGKYKFAYHGLEWLIQDSPRKTNILDRYPFIKDYTVVPIPLHIKRLKERGYNQADVIARAVAKHYNLSINTLCLDRSVYTNPQAGVKTKKLREAHMKGVFRVGKTEVPQKVLLVDDVFTTGATMKDATRALKSGGASEVFGFTIAR